LLLPAGSTFCPECGKDFREELLGKPSTAPSKEDHRRMNLLTMILVPAALAFGILTFQFGFSALFLAFTVPALAFVLVYVWERNRGLKPGWEFIALSVVGTYAGAIFGFIFVLVPVLIYFIVMRYLLKQKELRKAKFSVTHSA
jgi:hypothetical protein